MILGKKPGGVHYIGRKKGGCSGWGESRRHNFRGKKKGETSTSREKKKGERIAERVFETGWEGKNFGTQLKFSHKRGAEMEKRARNHHNLVGSGKGREDPP